MDQIEKLPEGTRILILAPLVRGRKGTYQAVFEEIRKAGFTRVRVDGNVSSLDDEIELDRYKQHTIEAVVDRQHNMALVQTEADGRPHCGVHAWRGGTSVHDCNPESPLPRLRWVR